MIKSDSWRLETKIIDINTLQKDKDLSEMRNFNKSHWYYRSYRKLHYACKHKDKYLQRNTFYKEQLEQMTYYLLTLLGKSKYLTEIYSLNNKLNSYLERNNINVSDDPCNVKPTKVVKAEEAFTNVSPHQSIKFLIFLLF